VSGLAVPQKLADNFHIEGTVTAPAIMLLIGSQVSGALLYDMPFAVIYIIDIFVYR